MAWRGTAGGLQGTQRGVHAGLQAGAAQGMGNSLRATASNRPSRLRAWGPGPLCCSGSPISTQDPPSLPVPCKQLFSFLLRSQGRLRLAYGIAPISTMRETLRPHPPPPSWQSSRVFRKVLERQQ